jgi:predicted nucleotidyltransferase
MENMERILEEITRRLKELDPYKIILFGSLSKQNNDEESDIDLLVILNNDKISKNYKEKMEKKLLVRNLIWDLSKEIPIDLLVYTKREFEIIMENKNSFFKELEKTGKTIYEKAS